MPSSDLELLLRTLDAELKRLNTVVDGMQKEVHDLKIKNVRMEVIAKVFDQIRGLIVTALWAAFIGGIFLGIDYIKGQQHENNRRSTQTPRDSVGH